MLPGKWLCVYLTHLRQPELGDNAPALREDGEGNGLADQTNPETLSHLCPLVTAFRSLRADGFNPALDSPPSQPSSMFSGTDPFTPVGQGCIEL